MLHKLIMCIHVCVCNVFRKQKRNKDQASKLAAKKSRPFVQPNVDAGVAEDSESYPRPSYSDRTGPAVRSVKDRTRDYNGSIRFADRPYNRTGKNWLDGWEQRPLAPTIKPVHRVGVVG